MKKLKVLLFLSVSLIIASCANRVAPSGGPKDLTPPELVSSEPAASSTGFAGNTISLHFDEYVQLKEVGKQLIVSPPLASPPIVSASGKTVQLRFEKLQDATTYSFSFGNSI